MQIPIIIFLVLYLLVVTLFIVFSIFLVYHALRFGVASRANVVSLAVYLAGVSFLLVLGVIYIWQVDWSQSLVIS